MDARQASRQCAEAHMVIWVEKNVESVTFDVLTGPLPPVDGFGVLGDVYLQAIEGRTNIHERRWVKTDTEWKLALHSVDPYATRAFVHPSMPERRLSPANGWVIATPNKKRQRAPEDAPLAPKKSRKKQEDLSIGRITGAPSQCCDIHTMHADLRAAIEEYKTERAALEHVHQLKSQEHPETAKSQFNQDLEQLRVDRNRLEQERAEFESERLKTCAYYAELEARNQELESLEREGRNSVQCAWCSNLQATPTQTEGGPVDEESSYDFASFLDMDTPVSQDVSEFGVTSADLDKPQSPPFDHEVNLHATDSHTTKPGSQEQECQVDKLEAELKKAEARNSELLAQLDASRNIEAQLLGWKETASRLIAENQSLEQEVRSLRLRVAEVDKALAELEETRSINRHLEAGAEQLRTTQGAEELKAASLRSNRASLEGQISQLQARISQLRSDKDEPTKEFNTLQRRLMDKITELATANQSRKRTEADLLEVQGQLEHTIAENETLTKICADMVEEQTSLQATLSSLEADMKRVSTELEVYRSGCTPAHSQPNPLTRGDKCACQRGDAAQDSMWYTDAISPMGSTALQFVLEVIKEGRKDLLLERENLRAERGALAQEREAIRLGRDVLSSRVLDFLEEQVRTTASVFLEGRQSTGSNASRM